MAAERFDVQFDLPLMLFHISSLSPIVPSPKLPRSENLFISVTGIPVSRKRSRIGPTLRTPIEIVEAIMRCIPYTGFPRVLNAITAAKKVFGGQA